MLLMHWTDNKMVWWHHGLVRLYTLSEAVRLATHREKRRRITGLGGSHAGHEFNEEEHPSRLQQRRCMDVIHRRTGGRSHLEFGLGDANANYLPDFIMSHNFKHQNTPRSGEKITFSGEGLSPLPSLPRRLQPSFLNPSLRPPQKKIPAGFMPLIVWKSFLRTTLQYRPITSYLS